MAIKRRSYRIRVRARFYENLKVLSVYFAAGATIIFMVILLFNLFGKRSIEINLADITAMRVPYKSARILLNYAEEYDMAYSNVLAVFAVDNRFFSTRMASYSDEDILREYILGYNDKVKAYGAKSLQPYIDLFGLLLNEIVVFPVTDDYGGYMYGDSFGAVRLNGQPNHMGADIMDRENRAGRLEIVNIAAGVVEDYGIDDKNGYYIGVKTANGSYYFYAHLDSIAAHIVKGGYAAAGEIIGFMGSSGKDGTGYGYPVRLHLGIKVKTAFSRDDVWINPYIFLRLIE